MKPFSFSYQILAILLTGSVSFFSCGGADEHAPVLQAAAGSLVAPDMVSLSADQMDRAGIELGLPVTRLMSDYIECTGRVEAPPQSLASVHSPVAGTIKELYHLPGQFVKKGERLALVQNPELVKLQRSWLESRSKLPFLRSNAQRLKELSAADAVALKTYQQAQSELDFEEAQYKGIKAELAVAGLPVEQLEQSGEIQTTLALFAPVGGFISATHVHLGQWVNPPDALVEITDNSHLHLELAVFAQDILRVKEGQRVACKVSGSNEAFEAEIHLPGRVVDPMERTAMVHAHFEKEPVHLLPGTLVQARVFVQADSLPALPESALITQGDEHFVFVQSAEGFRRVVVSPGVLSDGYRAVPGLQLKSGEQVVLQGSYYINGVLMQSGE